MNTIENIEEMATEEDVQASKRRRISSCITPSLSRLPADLLLFFANMLDVATAIRLAQTCADFMIVFRFQFQVLKAVWFDRIFDMHVLNDVPYISRKPRVIGVFRHVMVQDNLEVQLLPSSVRSITFNAGSNQPIADLKLPNGLQQLTFGEDFNQPVVDLKLPEGLRQLTL